MFRTIPNIIFRRRPSTESVRGMGSIYFVIYIGKQPSLKKNLPPIKHRDSNTASKTSVFVVFQKRINLWDRGVDLWEENSLTTRGEYGLIMFEEGSDKRPKKTTLLHERRTSMSIYSCIMSCGCHSTSRADMCSKFFFFLERRFTPGKKNCGIFSASLHVRWPRGGGGTPACRLGRGSLAEFRCCWLTPPSHTLYLKHKPATQTPLQCILPPRQIRGWKGPSASRGRLVGGRRQWSGDPRRRWAP